MWITTTTPPNSSSPSRRDIGPDDHRIDTPGRPRQRRRVSCSAAIMHMPAAARSRCCQARHRPLLAYYHAAPPVGSWLLLASWAAKTVSVLHCCRIERLRTVCRYDAIAPMPRAPAASRPPALALTARCGQTPTSAMRASRINSRYLPRRAGRFVCIGGAAAGRNISTFPAAALAAAGGGAREWGAHGYHSARRRDHCLVASPAAASDAIDTWGGSSLDDAHRRQQRARTCRVDRRVARGVWEGASYQHVYQSTRIGWTDRAISAITTYVYASQLASIMTGTTDLISRAEYPV